MDSGRAVRADLRAHEASAMSGAGPGSGSCQAPGGLLIPGRPDAQMWSLVPGIRNRRTSRPVRACGGGHPKRMTLPPERASSMTI